MSGFPALWIGITPLLQRGYPARFLFADGELGAFYSPIEAFTDTAGATPATWGDQIARINDQTENGLNMVQDTLAQRPLLGRAPIDRRNVLTWTEDFSSAFWQKSGTATVSGSVFRCGATSASELRQGSLTLAAGNATFSLEAAAEASSFVVLQVFDVATFSFQRTWFNLTTGAVGSSASGGAGVSFVSAGIESIEGGRYRCRISVILGAATTTARVSILLSNADAVFNGDASSGIFVYKAQLEPGDTATPYQRVNSAVDMTEAGVPSFPFVRLDGIDDRLVTAITAGGTFDIAVFGRLGSRIVRDVIIAPGGSITIGPTTFHGAPAGSIAAMGDIVGYTFIDRTITETELARVLSYFKARGAAEFL